METRYLAPILDEICFRPHKMALVSGPRQCGKTTMAKTLLQERGAGAYYNWDEVGFRRIWTKSPASLWPAMEKTVPMLVLDEVHKARGWKRTVKGLYDTRPYPAELIVTGSARLNVYKKGGDSLLGRSYHFRLHPFSQAELSHNKLPSAPDDRLAALFGRSLKRDSGASERYQDLLRFGGFPEPYLAASDRQARLWRHSRVEKVIREDLRDLSRLPELSRVEMMAALLPSRVGSAFSRASLREDLEVSFDTIKRWVELLKELYYIFEIRPFTSRVSRTLKKEGKVYLWDWTEVEAAGPRFENLVACHLLKACDFWTDTGEGTFALSLLRNKEAQEIDFLITRDGKPWLPVEAKLSDPTPAPHWQKYLRYLGCKQALQLVSSPGQWREHAVGDARLLVASAQEALGYLI